MKTLPHLLFSLVFYMALCPNLIAQASASASASASIVFTTGFEKDADMFFSVPWKEIKNQQLVLEAISRAQLQQAVVVTNPGASTSTAVFTILGNTNFTFDLLVNNNPSQVIDNGRIVPKEFTYDEINLSGGEKIFIEVGATLLINRGTQPGRFYSNNLEVSLNYN